MIEQDKIENTDKQLIASLPKAYEPQAVEGKWYRFWEEGGYFKPRPDAMACSHEDTFGHAIAQMVRAGAVTGSFAGGANERRGCSPPVPCHPSS